MSIELIRGSDNNYMDMNMNTLKLNSISENSFISKGGATFNNNVFIDGDARITGSLYVPIVVYDQHVIIDGTENSTSTSSGSLICYGGVGIAKDVFIGGDINANNINGNVITCNNIDGNLITNTVQSTSLSTGSLVVNGGIGIAKDIFIGGNQNITGNIQCNDATIHTNTCDNIVVLSTNNSNNYTNGSITTLGGVGITKDLNVNGTIICNNISSNILSLNGTNQSTSTSTGSLVINGGMGIAKNLNVGETTNLNFLYANNEAIQSTNQSTSTDTGALIVSGGAGISKNLNVGGNEILNGNLDIYGSIHIMNTNDTTNSSTGSLIVDGGVGITKNLFVNGNQTNNGIVNISNTTGTSSTNTGALIVGGGVGIAKNLFVGNHTFVNDFTVSGFSHSINTMESTTTDTGALIVDGGVGIAKNLNIGGNLNVSGTLNGTINLGTNQSTSTNSGALIVGGGVGIAKNLNVGGSISQIGTGENYMTIIGGNDNDIGIKLSEPSGSYYGRIFYGSSTSQLTDGINLSVNYSGNNYPGLGINSSITKIFQTTAATSTDTGALQVLGGIGIAKNSYIGGNEIITGNLNVNTSSGTGTMFQVSSSTQSNYYNNTKSSVIYGRGSDSEMGRLGGGSNLAIYNDNTYSSNPIYGCGSLVIGARSHDYGGGQKIMNFTRITGGKTSDAYAGRLGLECIHTDGAMYEVMYIYKDNVVVNGSISATSIDAKQPIYSYMPSMCNNGNYNIQNGSFWHGIGSLIYYPTNKTISNAVIASATTSTTIWGVLITSGNSVVARSSTQQTSSTGIINLSFSTPYTISALTQYYVWVCAFGAGTNTIQAYSQGGNSCNNTLQEMANNTQSGFNVYNPKDWSNSTPTYVPWFMIY